MKIGDILREARENKGLTLSDVEDKTKIRSKYLQALEEEDFEEIPGEAYCLGFLRNYARFLGLDPEPILNQYKSQQKIEESDSLQAVLEPKAQVEPTSDSSRGRTILGFAIIAVIVFVAAFIFFSSRGDNSSQTEQNPTSIEEIEKKETDPEQSEPVPQAETITLQIVGKQQCWAEVRVDGSVEFSGHIYSGDKKNFEANDSIQIRLGNAGGVDLIYNGEKEPPAGKTGEVVNKEYKKSD